jgi:ubiquinol-cytochrome c reductase cytochrome b/c1 subunit
VFYIPDYLGDPVNYVPFNPGQTPAEIVPEWYFLPFYAILRSIPNKLLGVIMMFGAIAMLALLPWLDTSKVRSAVYRPVFKWVFFIFVAVCLGLGWVGSQPPQGALLVVGRVLTGLYFAYFIIVLPLLGLFEQTKPVPASIADAILANSSGEPAPQLNG